MKKFALLAAAIIGFVPAVWAGASPPPGSNLIFGINKQQQFIQLDGTTTGPDSPDEAAFSAFIAGSPQSASFPSTSINITTPSSQLHPLTFDSSNNQWGYENALPNLSALNSLFPDGTYIFQVGGNSANISLTGSTYSNVPMAATVSNGTWLNGTLYVTPDVSLTINSNVFSVNYVAGQSRIALQAEGQNTGLNFQFDSLNDPIPLSTNTGNLVIPGTALASGNIYQMHMEFNVFVDFTDPGLLGGRNVALYTMQTTFDIVAGSAPIPEPATNALLAGTAALCGTIWWRRRKQVKA